MANRIGLRFITFGLVALSASLLAGLLAALKYLYPELLDALPFQKLRPLHVSLAISWIFLVAIGGIYYYLPRFCGLTLYSRRAAGWHFWIFLLSGLAIIAAYMMGRFGGREYLEFPPILALPIFIGWLLFGVNFFKTLSGHKGPWPVHYWMWATGIIFFLLTLGESYLWLIPYFRDNVVRELAVQWKSYGSLIGSWNMLVYGTAIFIMGKISGDDALARSKLAFSLYFIGLTALMFGWAHHAYALPFAPWVRTLAYIVSMTELIILAKIIWDWKQCLSLYKRSRHCQTCDFLMASDVWIVLNLILAIIISIPAANLFTHGTHITVAHAMGTTIGINTMILLASVFFVIEQGFISSYSVRLAKLVSIGFWLSNIFLFVFWIALIGAGVTRGLSEAPSFSLMSETIRPYLLAFLAAGGGLLLGLWLITLPALIVFIRVLRRPAAEGEEVA